MKDLMVAAGKYTSKSGETKTRWVSIGVMMENDKGAYLLLEPHINLAGFDLGTDRNGNPNNRLMVSVFERQEHANRDSTGRVESKPAPQADAAPFDDEIQF